MTRALAISLGLLLLTGCSPYRAPSLDVRAAEITNVSEEGIVIRFDVDAENTNAVELPLKRVKYRLYLDGREAFRGIRSPEATLRRLGTQSISLPAVVAIDEQLRALEGPVRYRLEGTLVYTTPGSVAEILFDAGVRRPRVRFRDTGTLSIPLVEGATESLDDEAPEGETEAPPADESEQLDPGTVGVGDDDVDP